MTEVALGGLLGFSFFWLTSHHKSPVSRRLPSRRIKNVHIWSSEHSLHNTPEIRIARKDKHYHVHHWAIFGVSYLPLLLMRRKIRSKLLHGFFIGSILQGLTYKDRFNFIKPLTDLAELATQPVEGVIPKDSNGLK